jgi:hypothetical protein
MDASGRSVRPIWQRGNQSILASGLNILAGLWLIISPIVLRCPNHDGAQWDCIIAAIRTWGPPSTAWLAWVAVQSQTV